MHLIRLTANIIVFLNWEDCGKYCGVELQYWCVSNFDDFTPANCMQELSITADSCYFIICINCITSSSCTRWCSNINLWRGRLGFPPNTNFLGSLPATSSPHQLLQSWAIASRMSGEARLTTERTISYIWVTTSLVLRFKACLTAMLAQ